MLGGQTIVVEYPISKSLRFECSAKHVVHPDVSTIGVYLKNTHQEAQQVKKIQIKYFNSLYIIIYFFNI